MKYLYNIGKAIIWLYSDIVTNNHEHVIPHPYIIRSVIYINNK